MTLPDDVTIIIADVASTELVVVSPASADTLAHACHRAHSGLKIITQLFFKTDYIYSNLGPCSLEQSRQGFSISEGKDTRAEIPRKWGHGQWGQSWTKRINKDLQKSCCRRVQRGLSGIWGVYENCLKRSCRKSKYSGNIAPFLEILVMTLCAWHWRW